jgi:hypothetical protein
MVKIKIKIFEIRKWSRELSKIIDMICIRMK